MLENKLPSREDFAGCVSTYFHIMDGSVADLDLELVEVSELKVMPRQQAFSLFLAGPAGPILPQRTYRLAHEKLGELDLFIVPVSRKGDSIIYEVAFNLLLPSTEPGITTKR